MMTGKMDPKQSVIDELMKYLEDKDGDELGSAIKPKGLGVEAVKVEGMGDEQEPDGDESPMAVTEGDEHSEGGGEKLSPEEMDELIQALQSKLG